MRNIEFWSKSNLTRLPLLNRADSLQGRHCSHRGMLADQQLFAELLFSRCDLLHGKPCEDMARDRIETAETRKFTRPDANEHVWDHSADGRFPQDPQTLT